MATSCSLNFLCTILTLIQSLWIVPDPLIQWSIGLKTPMQMYKKQWNGIVLATALSTNAAGTHYVDTIWPHYIDTDF